MAYLSGRINRMGVIRSKSLLILFVSLVVFQTVFYYTLANGGDEPLSWLPGFLQVIIVAIYLYFYFIPLAIIVGALFEREPENVLFWGVFYLFPVILIYSLILSLAICWIKRKFTTRG